MDDYVPTEFKGGFSIIENAVFRSKAFCGLVCGCAPKIYALLRTEARMPDKKYKKEHRGRFYNKQALSNNGKIELTYRDIRKLLKVSRSTIATAFRELEARGLIDVTQAGKVYQKTLYALSERWQDFDTPDFQDVRVQRNISEAGAKGLKQMHKKEETERRRIEKREKIMTKIKTEKIKASLALNKSQQTW
jgi:DNA-binding transcriptional regulator GbsR (MarR family)